MLTKISTFYFVNASKISIIVAREEINMRNKFYQYIVQLQQKIVSQLEAMDGTGKFQEDEWKRPGGGGGLSRVIENGTIFEKGGVNISRVHGELPLEMQKALGVSTGKFFACGLSLVLHPKNPKIPTTHANWRYFELYNEVDEVVDQWFGGGLDLTPYYLDEADATHWHEVCKKACDPHNREFYPKYKKECDRYFWNNHREEARGIGGLFFDYLKPTPEFQVEQWYDFVTAVGDSFLEAYLPIVEKHRGDTYSALEKKWQEIRRGRYVEFNLIYDRGTLFGLRTNGRIESILMSLPPQVQWVYDYHPAPDSEEEKLVKVLQQPREWIKS